MHQPDRLGHYEDWLELEKQYGFRSTFFFLAPEPTNAHVYDMDYLFSDSITYDGHTMTVAQMMREIGAAGWEIGLHGSYLSALDSKMMANQKHQIENVVKQEVRSVRQHYLQYDVAVTPRLQAEAGLVCDSTQGFNLSMGFRASTSFPYWCWDHQNGVKVPVLEIPMAIMDGSLFERDALGYNTEDAIRHCLALMSEVADVGGCLTLNWHPNYLNDARYWRTYSVILAEAANRNAWGCSAGQLYDWWTSRERRLLQLANERTKGCSV